MESLRDQLYKVKRKIESAKTVHLEVPNIFSFKEHGVADFEKPLSFFDWRLRNVPVTIDLSSCKSANYQAASLLVLYAWVLKSQGCRVTFKESATDGGLSEMFRLMGARGIFPVLFSGVQQFKGHEFKPLLAVRNHNDFKKVIESAEHFTEGFNVEYEETLRYVLSELLYNALEHGKAYGTKEINNRQIPAITQFTWYKTSNEIHFIIADVGIGVKAHIEQAYPGQETDSEAILLSLKAQHSGTFGVNDPYTSKNNAGMGLYISSNIISRLQADMYIVSGNGLVHVSPRDTTRKDLESGWPGTFVLVTIRLDNDTPFELTKLMQEFREAAEKEQIKGDARDNEGKFLISIENFFGRYAEDKDAAIRFRDRKLFGAVEDGKIIVLDFKNVKSSPHSFLSALIASPIKRLGMQAYKRFKVINAVSEIRETIDFIFDDNIG